MQLYYQDLVTMDVFEREQQKLKAEAKAARRLRRVAIVQTHDIEGALDEALRRIEHPHESYLEATPIERRVMNRAIFERIEVGEDSEITGTTLTPTYQALSAWQPRLGRSSACPQADAEGKAGPHSVSFRPASGTADYHSEPRISANAGEKARKRWVRGRLFAGVRGTRDRDRKGTAGTAEMDRKGTAWRRCRGVPRA